ncbi:MAG: ABC transporter permease [Verrucomicrobiota bacterium JB024]|nr:ABC transporter permease [Verrucomicrobiota bacterium JB024]
MATTLILVFLYLPILVLFAQSFNDARFGGSWNGFTLKWYKLLFEHRGVITATENTLIVAVTATLLSTVLGTLAAWALHRFQSRMQKVHQVLIYGPLVVPDILMGISLLLLFVNLSVPLGLGTVIVAHSTFGLSYVAFVVLGRLQEFDHSLLDAARDLGAGSWTTLWRVLLPLLWPGIAAGALLAFTLSLDDFVITFFVAGPGSSTLPVQVYGMMKHGQPALINALSVLFMSATFGIVLASQFLLRKRYD